MLFVQYANTLWHTVAQRPIRLQRHTRDRVYGLDCFEVKVFEVPSPFVGEGVHMKDPPFNVLQTTGFQKQFSEEFKKMLSSEEVSRAEVKSLSRIVRTLSEGVRQSSSNNLDRILNRRTTFRHRS